MMVVVERVVVRTNEEELVLAQRKTIQDLRDELDQKSFLIESLKIRVGQLEFELSVFKVNC